MPDRTNEEGGSHREGLTRRLSACGDDLNNVREKFEPKVYRNPPKEEDTGCFMKVKQCFGLGGGTPPPIEDVDVVLFCGGIMSITVGLMLQELEPTWKIACFERLGAVAEESTNGWNNAGTGHSALCEPNYTPTKGDTVDATKAFTVNENWQLSRQYWTYLANTGAIQDPNSFINVTPHITFAHGDDQLNWAQARYEVLSKNPLFDGITHTTDHAKMKEWCPLMFEGRAADDKVSMTMVPYGTDVDFGALTKMMAKGYMKKGGKLQLYSTVSGLKKEGDKWLCTISSDDLGHGTRQLRSKFVFVGAGGWAILLLQKSGIPEIKGFMGFPISGEFLVCQKEEIAEKHIAKCYGKAAIGAPPMSVPHLDSRIIGGNKMVLFGPFAGFSPRFLKTGSLLDLIKAVKWHNLIPAAAAGLQNLDLTIYLAKQLLATKADKLAALREFVPDARAEDWTSATAGQRVQIMKKDPKKWGILQFGTEVVAASDGSICGLLGASPGASTAVQVALDVITKCFAAKTPEWTPKIKKMIPSYGTRLADDPALLKKLHADSARALNIK